MSRTRPLTHFGAQAVQRSAASVLGYSNALLQQYSDPHARSSASTPAAPLVEVNSCKAICMLTFWATTVFQFINIPITSFSDHHIIMHGLGKMMSLAVRLTQGDQHAPSGWSPATKSIMEPTMEQTTKISQRNLPSETSEATVRYQSQFGPIQSPLRISIKMKSNYRRDILILSTPANVNEGFCGAIIASSVRWSERSKQ